MSGGKPIFAACFRADQPPAKSDQASPPAPLAIRFLAFALLGSGMAWHYEMLVFEQKYPFATGGAMEGIAELTEVKRGF